MLASRREQIEDLQRRRDDALANRATLHFASCGLTSDFERFKTIGRVGIRKKHSFTYLCTEFAVPAECGTETERYVLRLKLQDVCGTTKLDSRGKRIRVKTNLPFDVLRMSRHGDTSDIAQPSVTELLRPADARALDSNNFCADHLCYSRRRFFFALEYASIIYFEFDDETAFNNIAIELKTKLRCLNLDDEAVHSTQVTKEQDRAILRSLRASNVLPFFDVLKHHARGIRSLDTAFALLSIASACNHITFEDLMGGATTFALDMCNEEETDRKLAALQFLALEDDPGDRRGLNCVRELYDQALSRTSPVGGAKTLLTQSCDVWLKLLQVSSTRVRLVLKPHSSSDTLRRYGAQNFMLLKVVHRMGNELEGKLPPELRKVLLRTLQDDGVTLCQHTFNFLLVTGDTDGVYLSCLDTKSMRQNICRMDPSVPPLRVQKRLWQAFSQTVSLPISPIKVDIPDVHVDELNESFSDGCGFISRKVLSEIAAKDAQNAKFLNRCSSMQVRCSNAYKGMLVVIDTEDALFRQHWHIDDKQQADLFLPASMLKYPGSAPAASSVVEVQMLRPTVARPAFINHEAIMLLKHAGVCENQLEKLVFKYAEEQITLTKALYLDAESSQRLLGKIPFDYLCSRNVHTFSPELLDAVQADDWNALKAQNIFFSEVHARVMDELRQFKRFRVHVPFPSCRIKAVCDPLGVLEEGTCFLRTISGPRGDLRTIARERVLLLRNPAQTPNDATIVRSVHNEELERMFQNGQVNAPVLVFPSRGRRSLAHALSGDLDGDEFLVLLEESLLPEENLSRVELPSVTDVIDDFADDKQWTEEERMKAEVEHFCGDTHDRLALTANVWKWVAACDGIGSQEALRLAVATKTLLSRPAKGLDVKLKDWRSIEEKLSELPNWILNASGTRRDTQTLLGKLHKSLNSLVDGFNEWMAEQLRSVRSVCSDIASDESFPPHRRQFKKSKIHDGVGLMREETTLNEFVQHFDLVSLRELLEDNFVSNVSDLLSYGTEEIEEMLEDDDEVSEDDARRLFAAIKETRCQLELREEAQSELRRTPVVPQKLPYDSRLDEMLILSVDETQRFGDQRLLQQDMYEPEKKTGPLNAAAQEAAVLHADRMYEDCKTQVLTLLASHFSTYTVNDDISSLPRLELSDDEIEELPLKREDIQRKMLEMVKSNQVTVVEAPTASGKSTEVPRMLLNSACLGEGQKIAVTQPRRVAAKDLAGHVRRNVVDDPSLVGYSVRFDRNVPSTARIVYLTDGTLVAEMTRDTLLRKWDIIIVDEIHERSFNTDVLIGNLLRVMARRPELRVVLMSATLNGKEITRFLKLNAPEISVDSLSLMSLQRRYNVHEHWELADWLQRQHMKTHYVARATFAALMLHRHYSAEDTRGNILVFLTGKADIALCVSLLRRMLEDIRCEHAEVLPFHAQQTVEEHERITSPQDKDAPFVRRIIISTNVAETSLTVPNVRFVVDAGLSKRSSFCFDAGIAALQTGPISRASADQRRGRTARVSTGVYVPLYTRKSYHEEMSKQTPPAFACDDISLQLLRVRHLRYKDPIRDFPWFTLPSKDAFEHALKKLNRLGLIKFDDNTDVEAAEQTRSGQRVGFKLTQRGMRVARVPLPLELATALEYSFTAQDNICSSEVLSIAALLSTKRRVLEAPSFARRQEARLLHEEFCDGTGGGDVFRLLRVFERWLSISNEAGEAGAKEFANRNSLSHIALCEAAHIREQLNKIFCNRLKLGRSNSMGIHGSAATDAVASALLVGFICNVAKRFDRKNSHKNDEFELLFTRKKNTRQVAYLARNSALRSDCIRRRSGNTRTIEHTVRQESADESGDFEEKQIEVTLTGKDILPEYVAFARIIFVNEGALQISQAFEAKPRLIETAVAHMHTYAGVTYDSRE
ncbi:MAG: hypothetical protein MHM6MM_002862 [Cercozoa sp. M6MM]